MKKLLISAAAALACVAAPCVETPTMGWSSWNTYRVNISDSLIMEQARAMVDLGLDKAGYKYINIDDGYFGGRDEMTGRMKFHPVRFPDGLKPVVDYIHSLGLKAGTYSDAGANTCGNYWDKDSIARNVGLLGHERQDCDMFFNELGFDFIKVDFCGGNAHQNTQRYALDPQRQYTAISEAIKATGRDDVRLNVCRWDYPGTWVSDVATSWRTTHDIYCAWESVRDIIAENLYLSAYAGEGKYNDMDMLEVGRTLTGEEDRTHFGMWCMMSSPLLIGCDMTQLRPETLGLLKNKELISIDQDSLGLQAYVVKRQNGGYVLVKDLEVAEGPLRAVAFYNPTDDPIDMSVDFADVCLAGKVSVRDAYECRDEGILTGGYKVTVPAHGTKIYRMRGEKRLMRHRYEGETAYLSSYQEIYNPLAVGTAYYAPDDRCSGGIKVTQLGNTPVNDLVWKNVMCPQAGMYTVTIDCLADCDSEFYVSVNDGAGELHKVAGDGTLRQVTFTGGFRKGQNAVRLYNDRNPMPEIDGMSISKAE